MKRNQRSHPDPKVEKTHLLLNNLKKKYETHRSNFLKAFSPLYCSKSMDVPHIGNELVSYCDSHKHKNVSNKHYESIMYLKNIINWIDIKLNYTVNKPISKPIKDKKFKISYIHDKKQTSTICLNFKNGSTRENYLTQESIYTTDTFNPTNTLASCTETSMNTVIVNENPSKNVVPFLEENKVLDGFVTANFEANEIMCDNKEKENTSQLSTNTINGNNNYEDEQLGESEDSNLKESDDNFKNPSHKLSTTHRMNDNINYEKENMDVSENISQLSTNTINGNINYEDEKLGEIEYSNLKESDDNFKDPSHKLSTIHPMNDNINYEKENMDISENISHELSNNIPINSNNNKEEKLVVSKNTSHELSNNTLIDDNINYEEDILNLNEINSFKETDDSLKNISRELSINTSINGNIKNEGKLDKRKDKSLSPVKTNFNKTKNISTSLKTSSTTVENHSLSFNNEANKKLGLDKLEQQSKKKFIGKRSNSPDSEHMSKKIKLESNSISLKVSKNSTKIDENISNNNEETIFNFDCDKVDPIQINDSKKKVIKNMYVRNSRGETQLHMFCAKNKIDSAFELLKDGFNPNVKDNAGWTPLHDAVKNGRLQIVKLLIQFGAYINVPGFEYESPLFTAIKYGQFDIAKELLMEGADLKSVNMYGDNIQNLNEEIWTKLLKLEFSTKPIKEFKYIPENIGIFLSNVSLDSAIIKKFCELFNIKLIQNILYAKQLEQVTHIIVPVTKNNTCNVKFECLMGIANGTFIVNQNWIIDSLEHNILKNCVDYEVNGTSCFVDCDGPKLSRINKQKLLPKLFDGICIHITGNIGWENFSLEQLHKMVQEFGAKLLKRMPNSEDCPTNILPYHCRDNDKMRYVSNIILYTEDKNRLIKYNMEHLKVFPISWFMEAIQKFSIN